MVLPYTRLYPEEDSVKRIKRAAAFCMRVLRAAKKKVFKFVRDCYEHPEAIALLTLAAYALTNIIAQAPFYWTLPMWVEAPMVAPLCAVLIVKALVWNMNRRANKRAQRAQLHLAAA